MDRHSVLFSEGPLSKVSLYNTVYFCPLTGPGTNKRQTRGPDSNPHYWKLVAVVATILFAVIIGLYCSQYNI